MSAANGTLFSKVSISLTKKCNIACEHCMPESGPEQRRLLEVARLLGWIEKLADFGTTYLAFTGGEPFIVPDLLSAGSDLAAQRGMTVSVMTNAFWAKTVELGEARLRQFPALRRIASVRIAFIGSMCRSNTSAMPSMHAGARGERSWFARPTRRPRAKR